MVEEVSIISADQAMGKKKEIKYYTKIKIMKLEKCKGVSVSSLQRWAKLYGLG